MDHSMATTTLLATAMAKLSVLGESHQVRILIDAGSELTFISNHLCKSLKLQRQRSSVSIIGIGGTQSTRTKGMVSVTLGSNHSTAVVTIQAHILSTVSTIIPSFKTHKQVWPHLQRLTLADPDHLTPRPIDILIGADSYGLVIKPNIIKGMPSMPIAQLSIFGWLILGPVRSSEHNQRVSHAAVSHEEEINIYNLLSKFWVQEELPSEITPSVTQEEEECENHFKMTHRRDSTGRYVVRLPLKSPSTSLGKSFGKAHQCLQRVEKRLHRDNQYRQLYEAFMKEYEDLGHMVPASYDSLGTHQHGGSGMSDVVSKMTSAHDTSVSGGLRVLPDSSSRQHPSRHVFYLPHHGVLKPDSATTKLRVVFNGSSATSSGISLNDIMHTGPNMLLDISDVLTWIRQHRHIFATDITKMYRQIRVHEDDWDLQRILWYDNHHKVTPFNLTTVTYGTRAAPYLAVRTLVQLAEDEGQRFPLAIPSIMKGRYVDDIFGGADSIDQLIEVANQLVGLCNAGCFPLAKWHATDIELLKAISSAETPTSGISFDDCATKVLGLKWLPQSDRFTFTSHLGEDQSTITKRLILSEVAQIFDPLGFVSPVIIRAKILLQELWLHKLGWDDPIPSHITSQWLSIRNDLKSLAKLSIPRWFNTWSNSTVEIHGFADASQLAMGAVVYLVTNSPSTGATSALISSKTKVAPLKRLTIPRLELTAALLLARLVSHIKNTLTHNITNVYMWTDSRVTLTWIKSHPSKWKDYVRNRVSSIQELSATSQWRHVPGVQNPADIASRGITTTKLVDHKLWWTGPPWITKDTSTWPQSSDEAVDDDVHEVRPGVSMTATVPNITYRWDLITRYSNLHKLLKITTLCFRFLSLVKRKVTQPINSAMSICEAEQYWVKETQLAYFSLELRTLKSSGILPVNHPFTRLTAFIDSEGIIRVGGRLSHSSLRYEEKHPAILPRQSRLSALIIDSAHRRTLHGGVQITLANIRQSYWIIGGRAPVKSHILKCVVCARQRGIKAQQLMGQLPQSRVTPSRPFLHTGVDYAGPLSIKSWKGRGTKTYKGWICVFVCFSTSAVHLEAVTDYSTEGFLAAYRRFISRRGIPHTMYSDRGTNFIGADTTLKQLSTQASREHQHLTSVLVQDRTQWSFNPPAAPHMGGKWEAMVKSIKFHLKRTIGETLLTLEELMTMFTQIEALLNSRPLEPLSDDPEDVSALTPGHFLIGCALTSVPESSLKDLDSTRLSKWQHIQQRVHQFWNQWTSMYLQRLQSISKWHHPRTDIQIGSLVLITDERMPASKWPLARVIALHPGPDGHTRVVDIKTASTTLTRPISKLAPLTTPSWD